MAYRIDKDKLESSLIKSSKLDNLFGDETNFDSITDIDITELFSFKEHPFKVIKDSKMNEMVESIKIYGVLTPIIVRPKNQNGYEIISGHRRKYACELCNLKTVPAIIRNISDEEATIIMVDSNLQREEILPSEKAFAYKMKLDAIKKQGKRTDLTSGQVVQKLNNKSSVEIIAEENNENYKQIQRYIRLTKLNMDLLDMIDNKTLPFNVGVELSYLSKKEQEYIFTLIKNTNILPTINQSNLFKKYSVEKTLTTILIDEILKEKIKPITKISFNVKKIQKYFPSDYTAQQIEKEIIKLLENKYTDK